MIPLLLATALAGPYDEGVMALREARFDDAKSLFEQAITVDDRKADALWELGWAHWSLNDFAGAQRAWEQVAAIDPQRPDLNHWLASARARVVLKGAPPPEAAIDTAAAPGKALRFAAVGDTMMGSDLVRGPSGLPADDGKPIFEPIRDHLASADVAFANLEGPLADGLPSSKCKPDSTSCYAFRTPTRFTAALTYAGIDLASLANNHAFDLGSAGQESSMKALDQVGIAHAGRYGDTGSITRDGVTIALVAASSGACCLNVNALDEVRAAVALADRDHDLVVFSFHGGAEGGGARRVLGKTEIAWGEKRGDLKALARAAIDAGADLVIGHGPHVLRAMEVYKGRLVAYSLGNFVGYKQFGRGEHTGTSAILKAELAPNGVLVSASIVPLVLDENSSPVPDPTGLAIAQINELSKLDFPETGVEIAADGKVSW